MSIFKYLFDNEWSQRSDIERLSQRTRAFDNVTDEVISLRSEVSRLESDLGRTLLLSRALTSLLLSKGICDAEELEQTLRRLDLQDGVEDGRMAEGQPAERFCENCGRPKAREGGACPYCGELTFSAGELPAR